MIQAVLILTLTGIVLAVAIGLVVKYFGVEQDPRAEKLMDLVPGANCGGCGFAGCADYVNAIIQGKAKLGMCTSMTDEAIAKASELLGGAAMEAKEKKVAVVCCQGDDEVATSRAFYNGVTDCINAQNIANGGKACTYGCLGFGSCARACPFGAIEITEKHIAVVHTDICKGCGKCIATCPRHIIKLVPASVQNHVLCSNPESFKLKKTACKAGCTGCKKCAKSCEEGQITFNGFLASINYDNPPKEDLSEVCPFHVIKKSAK